MRSTTAVRPNTGSGRGPEQPENVLVRRPVWAQEERRAQPTSLLTGDASEPAEQEQRDKHFCWSEAILWAWEDLNLRPHPYQVSRAQRCADRRFPRSCASVRGEGMRSNNPARTSARTHCHSCGQDGTDSSPATASQRSNSTGRSWSDWPASIHLPRPPGSTGQAHRRYGRP
jgi:hypothetical protein